MSSSSKNSKNTNTNTSAAAAATRYCKVCADADKSKDIVASHNTKTSDGVVVCPTLLSQNCRYCHANGHTVKYCKTLLAYNKINSKLQAQLIWKQNAQTQSKAQNPTLAKNSFSAFYDSDSDGDNSDGVNSDGAEDSEFPSLTAHRVNPTPLNDNENSYANALTKTGTKTIAVRLPSVLPSSVVPSSVVPSSVVPTVFRQSNSYLVKSTFVKVKGWWATCESSSDEESDAEDVAVASVDEVAC